MGASFQFFKGRVTVYYFYRPTFLAIIGTAINALGLKLCRMNSMINTKIFVYVLPFRTLVFE